MSERSGENAPPGRAIRERRPVSWSVVVTTLIVTCIAMLFAIYWVVRTGKL
jgi:hypothetical protein